MYLTLFQERLKTPAFLYITVGFVVFVHVVGIAMLWIGKEPLISIKSLSSPRMVVQTVALQPKKPHPLSTNQRVTDEAIHEGVETTPPPVTIDNPTIEKTEISVEVAPEEEIKQVLDVTPLPPPKQQAIAPNPKPVKPKSQALAKPVKKMVPKTEKKPKPAPEVKPKPAQIAKSEKITKPTNDLKKTEDTEKIKAARAKRRALLAKAQKNIGEISSSPATTSSHGSKIAAIPGNIEGLHVDSLQENALSLTPEQQTYYDRLAIRLKNHLCLPEYGKVRLKLTLNPQGQFIKAVVLQAESRKNRDYLEQTLSTLQYPKFGTEFGKVDQYTFTLAFSSD